MSIIDTIKKSGEVDRVIPIPGEYSARGASLLQHLAKHFCNHKKSYYEIGVYKGGTLLNVANFVDPGIQCYGIDNYSQFGITSKEFSKNRQALGIFNAHLLEWDFEFFLESKEPLNIGMAFVDGPHDYRSQIYSLMLLKKHMTDYSCIVIDDANYPHVRQATRDFLKTNPDWVLAFEAYSNAHPKNAAAKSPFYNGVHVIVKGSGLPPMYPSAADREQFLLDHEVHSDRYSKEVTKALKLYRAISFHRPRPHKSMNIDIPNLKIRYNEDELTVK